MAVCNIVNILTTNFDRDDTRVETGLAINTNLSYRENGWGEFNRWSLALGLSKRNFLLQTRIELARATVQR